MGDGPTSELREGLQLLDRYTVVDRFAGGGMSDIYRAHDTRLDRIVCVKVLRNVIEEAEGLDPTNLADSDSDRVSERVAYQATYTHFLQEAQALSKLSHPNTLRIYDFGFLEPDPADRRDIPRQPFQVSEFLDGGNLETYVRSRGAMNPVEVLAIVDRIAGAIAEAHGVGIIHRDIKPSNILFAKVGNVLMPKLADFGIARDVRRRRRPSGEILREISREIARASSAEMAEPQAPPPIPLFSPRWAAPEQLASLQEGSYTDVYALGLVVAFMLAGRGLFEVKDIVATYAGRASGDAFVRSRLALHPFAPEVARVLMAALRTDLKARTQSPFEFYEALCLAFGTPRATLPSLVAHSGSVPPPAPKQTPDSVSVKVSFKKRADALSIEPPEQCFEVAGRNVRIVETHEKLDVTFDGHAGEKVRVRVTWLPARGTRALVHFKGLNCFLRNAVSPTSPLVAALVAEAETDASAALVSTRGQDLARLSWSFGTLRDTSSGPVRVFSLAAGELVVPFPHGQQAILIELSAEQEAIVICRSA